MKQLVFKIQDEENDPLGTKEFLADLINTSIQHKKQNRALAFAFLVYDFESPHIAKILEDKHYWDSLNKIASHYLSIYYIHSDAESLNEQNVYFSPSDAGKIINHMFGYRREGGPSDLAIPVLGNFFNIREKIELPVLIFFQIEDQSISDSIFIELEEEKIEESFLEIKETVLEVVKRLKDIDKENYQNSDEIFRELKTGIDKLSQRKVFNKFKKHISITDLINLFGV